MIGSRVKTLLPRPVRSAIKRAIGVPPPGPLAPATPGEILRRTLSNLAPLRVRREEAARPTLSMITDTIAGSHLFGGVGTAVLFAVALAARKGMALRIVTRDRPPEERAIHGLLSVYNVEFPLDLELLFSAASDGSPVPLGPDDLVLTTSWWTTHAALHDVPKQQIVYLIQEDERMFYPGGDQQLLCNELLQEKELRYVVNTSLLLQHFRESGAAGPAANGVAFEPAFPDHIYRPEPGTGRRKLLFYARPGHPRNLFLRGLQAIAAATEHGLFPSDAWELHFAGVDIPPVDLPGREIAYHDSLPWQDYAALVRGTDLALSLMYTPHPSYPPLDIAASGGVVVTNSFGVKSDLSGRSANIIIVPTTLDGILDGLMRGSVLAIDDAARAQNRSSDTIVRSWDQSFGPVFDRL
ncbi:hypothetical protein SAMN06297144_1397 [Sphingomonas guangdongensis]|uniref:Uncharacterized protein n=1 Tax=Sphingomonas guangdongensis TaxID=1141890 RepID=A0A285QGM5_9SPHN|nr:hypothetical protein [Sphingomonas guangdongensis]SOB81100.1 hypothetical protein SAMN06297144_1397 [Sphingomonas guangdongensis]